MVSLLLSVSVFICIIYLYYLYISLNIVFKLNVIKSLKSARLLHFLVDLVLWRHSVYLVMQIQCLILSLYLSLLFLNNSSYYSYCFIRYRYCLICWFYTLLKFRVRLVLNLYKDDIGRFSWFR